MSFLEAIGLKWLPLAAGFFGAMISLKFIEGLTMGQRASTVLAGAVVAGYCTPLTVELLTLSARLEGPVAFLGGLFGMSIAGALIKAIPEWVSAAKQKLFGGWSVIATAIFMSCCAVLFVVPLIFVLHKVYQDGFFGRCGLLGIAFTAATFLLEWAGGNEYQMLPQTVALVFSFTVFLCWHLVRFHLRVVLASKAKTGQVERRLRDLGGQT